MNRTILEIARDVTDRVLSQRPTTLFGNDRNGRALLVAANDASREIMRAALGGSGWSALLSTWLFRLEPGVGSYALPPDFAHMIPDTFHRQAQSVATLGPTPSAHWAAYLYGMTAPVSSMAWRVANGRLYVEPVPTVAEFATVGYVSRYPVVQRVDGADFIIADVPAEDATRVRLPLVTREGYLGTSASALSMTEDEFSRRFRLLTPVQGVDVVSEAMARKAAFTLDTDWPALDDHLVGLGMTWRFLKALSRPYGEEKAEFEQELEVRLSTDHGGPTTFHLGRQDDDDDIVFGRTTVVQGGEIGGGEP